MPLKTAVLSLLAALCLPLGLAAKAPAWAATLPLYEINPEHYSAQGTFAAIQADLPRLKALGAGILWLTPIQTRGKEKGFNSPYCIRDYEGVHAPFGGKDDFKALVAAAHAQGLYVILDWVANHTAWDHPWVKAHPDWYEHGADGAPAPVKDFIDIFQLDYRSRALRQAMLASMTGWVRDTGIDGFRCDMAWRVPADFWAEARAALDRIKPVFLLAESDEAWDADSFDADYDWHLLPPVKDSDLILLAQGKRPATVVDRALIAEAAKPWPPDFFRLRATCNHDEWNNVGTPDRLYGPAAPALAVLMATLPGKPLVYNGQEVGWKERYTGARTGWNRPPDPPIDFRHGTRADWWSGLYTRLLHAYQADPALNAGNLVRVDGEDGCRSYVFVREKGADKAVVILNLSPDPTHARLEHPALAGRYRELFTQMDVELGGTFDERLEPWEYRVLLSGPGADRLFAEPALAAELPAGWTLSPKPEAGPCATPEAYPSPVADPSPVAAACAGAKVAAVTLARLSTGSNPDGVTADFSVQWNQEALLIEVQARDRKLHAESSSPWDDDAVELYLDLNDARAGDYQEDDFQYILALDAKEVWERAKRVDGVVARTERRKDGWTLSLRLPWSTLKHAPKAGEVIGFDLGLDFNQDGTGRTGQLMLNGTSDNYKDTRHFSRLKLAPCP